MKNEVEKSLKNQVGDAILRASAFAKAAPALREKVFAEMLVSDLTKIIQTAQVEAVRAARIDELEMMAYDCYFGKTMTTQNEPPRIHYGDSVEADYIQDRLARLEQK